MENNNQDLDESKLPFNPRFTSEIVNAVSDNLIYDLNIGPDQIITQELTAQNQSSTKYDFEILCNETSYYPNKLIEGADFQVKITSHTYRQPGHSYNGVAWTDATLASQIADEGWYSVGGLGLGCKWLPGMMGFKAMPITRSKQSCTVSLGNLDHPYPINEDVLDFHLRSVPRDDLFAIMNGLSPFSVDNSKFYSDNSAPFPKVGNPFVWIAKNVKSLVVFGENLAVCSSRWNNVLGSHSGGNWVKPITSTFTTTEPGKTITYGTWYGYPTPMDGGAKYYSGANYQLIETHTFDTMYEPVLHPFLNYLQERPKLLSQVNKIRVSSQHPSNLNNIISCGYNVLGSTYQFPITFNGAVISDEQTVVTANASDMAVVVTATNRKLFVFQVNLQNEILPASIVKVPFMEEEVVSKVSTLSSSWQINKNIKLVSDPTNIDRIPKRVAIWVNQTDPDDALLHMTQGQGFAKIKRITMKLGNDASIGQSYTEQQLYTMAKKNGLHQYDYRDIGNTEEIVSQDTLNVNVTTGNGNGTRFLNQDTTIAGDYYTQGLSPDGRISRSRRGIGSRIMLEFGTDIPLKDSSMVAGISIPGGINFQLTVECDNDGLASNLADTYARLNYCFFYDDELDIVNNKAQTKHALFTAKDVQDSYRILRSRGNFRIKARYLMGGGLFSKLSNAVGKYLPKVTGFINQARDLHSAIQPHAQKVHSALSGVDNQHARSGQKLLEALNFN